MFSSILILTSVILTCTGAPAYFLVPANMSDPEEYVDWPTPPNPEYKYRNWWTDYDQIAEHVGLLHAGQYLMGLGRTQFTFTVDVRADGIDHELFTVGSLFSSDHVLTTCDGMILTLFKRRQPQQAKVTYCSLYLLEQEVSITDIVGHYGRRWVKRITIHPNCQSTNGYQNDVAMLQLMNHVIPAPPYITYMQVDRPASGGSIRRVDFPHMIANGVMCYVASFGKPYANIQTHDVLDFRVKYRVYYVPWYNCVLHSNDMCLKEPNKCHETVRRTDNRLVCLRTRAVVGTVCNHDRGAPVICDGYVVGIVIVGAAYEHCNDRLPLPFVMLTIESIFDFVSTTAKLLAYPSSSEFQK